MLKQSLKLVALALLVAFPASAQTPYCKGYAAGYSRGYCRNHGGQLCIPPITPICPIPMLGESTYQDGYDRGYGDGLAAN